jgi:hypothetical protein
MSTPIVEAPAPVAAAKPTRPWFKKKRFIVPPVAAIFFIAGATAGASGSSTTATPTPAVTVTSAPVTVTLAPPACGAALDLMGKFVAAVATEHSVMGAAFTRAESNGQLMTAFTAATAAANTFTTTTASLTPQMAAATSACRAAIK